MIVRRAPDFGNNTALNLYIDGKHVASFTYGRHYEGMVPAGDHLVTARQGGTLLGSAKMGANRPAQGAHVGTASFMVGAEARGKGVGRALAEYVVDWHRRSGFRAIQFNAVVETNTGAVRLWESLGFTVIGTVPEAFRRPSGEYVGLHVMHLPLHLPADKVLR